MKKKLFSMKKKKNEYRLNEASIYAPNVYCTYRHKCYCKPNYKTWG